MTKALELAKFGRETPPAGVVVGDSDTQTLSSKTFSDGPVFSSGTVNSVPFLNASKVFSTAATFVFDGTNLGIGVASPGYMLHVKGGAIAATSADGTVTSTFNYNTIGTITNSVFNIVANNSTRISIAPTTTTLSGSIYIENTNAINELTFTGSEYTNLVSNSTSAFDIGTNVVGPLLLTTNSIERVRILSGGNVGIGTPTPALKLDVNGSIKMSGGTGTALTWDTAIGSQYLKYDSTLDGLILAGYGGLGFRVAGSATNAVTVSSTGNLGIGAAPTAVTGFGINKFLEIGGASVPGLVLRPTGSTSEHSVLGAGDGLLIGAAGAATATNNVIRFFTSSVNSSNVSLGERLRIESNGNIKKLGTNGGLLLMDGNTAGGVKIGSYTSNFLGDGYLAFEGYSIEYGRFDSAGNFMVGVTSTSAIANRNIDVNGTGDASFNIRVGGTTRAYFYSTAGQTLLGTNTNIPITFYPNNIERMKIATDGAVTIGNAIAATNVVLNFNGVANKAKRLVFQDSGVAQWIVGSGAASENDAFEIYNANGQMALSFAKASSTATFYGVVAIPTLQASLGSTNGWINTSYGAIGSSQLLSYANQFFGYNLRGYRATDGGSTNNNFYTMNAHGSIGFSGIEQDFGGFIRFYTSSTAYQATTANTVVSPTMAMTIKPGGYVGIGTSDPSSPVHVHQSSGGPNAITMSTSFNNGNSYAVNPFIQGISNGGFSIRDVTNGVDRIVVAYSTGNVGIGTTNPISKLHIEGNDLTLNTENSPQAKTLYFRYSNGATVQSDSYLTFGTGGSPTEKVRIDSNGTFRIKGSGAAGSTDAVQFSGSAPASAMILDSSGRLGIGTTQINTGLSVWKANATTGYVISNMTGTMNVVDRTTPSAIGVGGRIVFGATYYIHGNSAGTGYVGTYKENDPSNGANEYNHALTFGVVSSDYSSGREVARFSSGGYFGIGRTSPAYTIDAYDASSGVTTMRLLNAFGLATSNGYGYSRFQGLSGGNGLFLSQNVNGINGGSSVLDSSSHSGFAISMGENHSGWAFLKYAAAGGTVTPTVPMLLTSAGNLLVGSTSTAGTNAPTAITVAGRLRSVAGTTTSIANGLTVDIALTMPRAIVSYYVLSDGNSNNQSAGFFRSNDNGASSNYTVFGQSEANVAVTGPSAGIIRITNNTGSSSAFNYVFTVLSGF